MCGIAGIVQLDGTIPDPAALARMKGSLAHRGPDDSGEWSEGPVGLVHTRLSIIDLGGSQQPMLSHDGRSVLVFNGEILNYRELHQRLDYEFHTAGDTETILAAHQVHGAAAPQLLRGQFAYALHDRDSRTLTLVRDRMGILPLYWYADDERLVFASDLTALIAGLGWTPDIDPSSLASFLAGRFVPAPDTLLTGVKKVRPGHRLAVSAAGSVTETAYWSPWPRDISSLTPEAAVDALDDLLGDAVDRALTADVPVGAYLSGGVDSSLIAARVSRAAGHAGVHTYCADFGDERDDDARFAAVVASELGTTHHDVAVSPTDFVDLWEPLSRMRGAPLSEPADIAVYRLAEAARADVKVILSGEGSDELFAGYPKHRFAAATARAGIVPALLRGRLLPPAEQLLPARHRRLGVALRALSEPTYDDRLRGWFAPFTSRERAALLHVAPREAARVDAGASPLRRMLLEDLRAWLPDNLLERGDRMSMAASLELRPPFLDHDVVEFSLALPPSLLVRDGVGKWLVKEVARRYLPSEVVDRPKSGFRVPLDRWFRAGLRDHARDLLLGSSSVAGQYFDAAAVLELLASHDRGRRDEATRIFTLTSLEVWYAGLRASASR